jgi:methyl-accepting chemotaxis protein
LEPRKDGKVKFDRHSISWRIILPVPIVTLFAIAVAQFVLPNLIERGSIDRAVADAQRTVNQFKELRRSYTEAVVAKAVKSGALKPDFEHRAVEGAIPLPAPMIHDLSELLRE